MARGRRGTERIKEDGERRKEEEEESEEEGEGSMVRGEEARERERNLAAAEAAKAAAHSEVEESEGDELGRDAGSTVPINTWKRRDLGSYNFSAEDEATLVEFYREHVCFYNKGSDNFSNSQYKKRLMRDMAAK